MKKIRFSICIATYKRRESLRQVLLDLCAQEGKTDLSVHEMLVCDNDFHESAKEVMAALPKNGFAEVRYFVVKKQNISLARNKLLQESKGEAIIYIDDDQRVGRDFVEKAEQFWRAWGSSISGAKFKVTPLFESSKRTWLREGDFFERPLPNEGEPVERFSTNGCIYQTEILRTLPKRFDPAFGRTGGEDTELFLRLKKQGAVLVSASSVEVFERIPESRETAKHILSRAFHHGITNGRLYRKGYFDKRFPLKTCLLVIARFPLVTVCLPISFQERPVEVLKTLKRIWYYAGLLVGFMGFKFNFY